MRVGNLPHATKDDHEELPFDREPESSSDEDSAIAAPDDNGTKADASAAVPSAQSPASLRIIDMTVPRAHKKQKCYGTKFVSSRKPALLKVSDKGQASKQLRNIHVATKASQTGTASCQGTT
jgi:hypothetical protein